MKQLIISLGVLVAVALISLGVGWYAGVSTIALSEARLDANLAAQATRVAQLESTLALVTNDALALRDALAAQELIATEATETLREALSAQASAQEQALADLAANVDITSIVDAWSPFVYDITCTFDQKDADDTTGSGSATVMRDEAGVFFVTNGHVVEDDKGGTLVRCALERNDADVLTVSASDIVILEEQDIAYGSVSGSPVAVSDARICADEPRIGERVAILGYPQIGAKESVTVTEGIISGFDKDFYTTSAKIEKGNSGGAAISVENNCFLGLPTLVFAGRVESLARILPILSIER